MVDDQDKKEDSFEFDSTGEAVEYVSLDQARLVAVQTARETPGNYGRSYAGVRMVFDLVEQEEREDYYVITLSFRPEGSFSGAPGREQFFIEKGGGVADRQVLSGLPESDRRRRFPVVLVVAAAAIVVGVAIGGVAIGAGVLGSGDGETTPTSVPIAAGVMIESGVRRD